jgi:hypothetical protein
MKRLEILVQYQPRSLNLCTSKADAMVCAFVAEFFRWCGCSGLEIDAALSFRLALKG